jgi:hypothetical protein
MQKKIHILAATSVMLILLTAACAQAAQPTAAPPVQPPAQQATQAPPAAPPATEAPTTGGTTQAPICQASASSCTVPDVSDIPPEDTYCVKKIPYQNVFVPDGTTFEVLDKTGDFTCKDQATFVNGKRVIACYGKELLPFQLKLTNPSCGAANLVTGTGQCQEGYGLDQAKQCCAPVSSGGTGSVTITVNMGACPLPQEPKK